MLVEAGRLTQQDADRILDYQNRAALPFGEAGIALGLLDVEDVQHALAAQFGDARPVAADAG